MRGHWWWYHEAMSGSIEPQVGIRELKDNASAVIRRVAAGETIQITDRGRAVARIVPLRGEDDWWDRMADEGRLTPARRDLIDVLRENPPPPLMPGERSAFDVLMELRADER
jgi:prevent-host-death family protein